MPRVPRATTAASIRSSAIFFSTGNGCADLIFQSDPRARISARQTEFHVSVSECRHIKNRLATCSTTRSTVVPGLLTGTDRTGCPSRWTPRPWTRLRQPPQASPPRLRRPSGGSAEPEAGCSPRHRDARTAAGPEHRRRPVAPGGRRASPPLQRRKPYLVLLVDQESIFSLDPDTFWRISSRDPGFYKTSGISHPTCKAHRRSFVHRVPGRLRRLTPCADRRHPSSGARLGRPLGGGSTRERSASTWSVWISQMLIPQTRVRTANSYPGLLEYCSKYGSIDRHNSSVSNGVEGGLPGISEEARHDHPSAPQGRRAHPGGARA